MNDSSAEGHHSPVDDDDFDDDDDPLDDDDDGDDDDDDDDDDNDDDDDDDDNTVPPEPDYDTDFEGFGAEATGGQGGVTETVTSLEDDGPGTLRQILQNANGPVVVQFDQDGVIDLQTVLDLPSDVTIDARGRDITITNNGFRIQSKSNIILMNMAFQDVDGQIGDCIQIIDESYNIVIFHCRFDNAGLMPFVVDHPDEQISIVWGSYNITISWCIFANHDKVLLFGNGDAPQETDEAISVTLHHNLFYNTGRRHPFLRYGRVDLYNNVIRNWSRYLEWPYGTRSQQYAQILSQANWYEQTNPFYFTGAYYSRGGKIKQVDNYQSENWIVLMENKPEEVFNRPYEANIQTLSEEWVSMMENHTGNTMPAADCN